MKAEIYVRLGKGREPWVLCVSSACGTRFGRVVEFDATGASVVAMMPGFVYHEADDAWAMSTHAIKRMRQGREPRQRRAPGLGRRPDEASRRVRWRQVFVLYGESLPATVKCPSCKRLQAVPKDLAGVSLAKAPSLGGVRYGEILWFRPDVFGWTLPKRVEKRR